MMKPHIWAAERTSTTTLADGRTLTSDEWGSESGFPVLFCTGAGMSGSLGFGLEHVHDAGIRLIAPDRPGLGQSSPHTDKSLVTWAADIQEFLTQQDISAFGAVGFSQGAPFAIALFLTQRLTALAIVAGQDDLSYPSVRSQLPPEVANLVQQALSDPAQFEAAIAANSSADWLWEFIHNSSSAADRAIYTHPSFAAAYRRSLAEGFSQGTAGYARDLRIALGLWPVKPEDVHCPVDIWYGRQDTSPVHSPDFGSTLTQRFPRATRHVLPDAGSALLWTHSSEILQRLLSASQPMPQTATVERK